MLHSRILEVAKGDAGSKASHIRYTSDGADPSASAPVFYAPFAVPVGTRIKAALFHQGKLVSTIASATVSPPPVPVRKAARLGK